MSNIRKVMHFMGVLDDGDIQWLASHGSRRFVPSGTILIREGEPVESLLILLDGQLSVTIKGGFLLATLQSGEMLGEISFIDARPPLATVTAVQNSHVLRVPRDILRHQIDTDIAFAARFFRAAALCLANRLRVTSSRLGYGSDAQDLEPNELDDALLDNLSLGATRFDMLLRSLSLPIGEVAGG
jgi:CRP/FNR family cyclic AMP-dependent transcriptional regulator